MKPTSYVKHGDLERAVEVHAGHEPFERNGQQYGRTDDDWIFILRDDSSVAVLIVSSLALGGRLTETPAEKKAWHEDYARRYGYAGKPPWALRGDLDFCTSFPTHFGSVRDGTKPGDCPFQRLGLHYTDNEGSTSIGADPLILELDRAFMEGPPAWWLADAAEVRRHLFEDDLGVWPKLEAWFREQRDDAQAAYRALPSRCTHCDGTGVIPPTRG